LFDKQNPFSPINRRISIIVMNKAAEQAVTQGEGATEQDSAAEAPPADPSIPTPAAKAGLDDTRTPPAQQ
jgi:chemotaxis protein MotB